MYSAGESLASLRQTRYSYENKASKPSVPRLATGIIYYEDKTNTYNKDFDGSIDCLRIFGGHCQPDC
jgi:hypothetical protein